ncbi:hypothetical protein N7467_012177 [Penicillium canescens]|nr:hypothetical protein N7467_012177 [Penicillium canescens]
MPDGQALNQTNSTGQLPQARPGMQTPGSQFDNYALNDYQMQLMLLLEQQNRRCWIMVRQEEDSTSKFVLSGTYEDSQSTQNPSATQQLASLPQQLRDHHNLIRKVLADIDACQHSLEQSRHPRIRNGIGGRSRHSRRRSRSHPQLPSRFLSWDCSPIRNQSEHHKHVAGAGLIGEPTAGLFERVRSRSPSRGGEPGRSHSPRKSLPIVGAGLGTAAVTGLYEKRKKEKQYQEPVSSGRYFLRVRNRAIGSPERYPDPVRDAPGFVDYGNPPVRGSVPSESHYGYPPSIGVTISPVVPTPLIS